VGYPKETMGYYFYFPPKNKVIVARSERTTHVPNRLCLNIEVKDDEVGDLGEPANYKAAMLDPDKDLGEAAYILGIKIYRDRFRRLIGLSESAYIDKILKKYNMHNFKKGYLPMEVKHDLRNELCASTPGEVAYMKKVHYALVVRSIMYAVRCTRPDVAFA
nr:retrotransposon protein, putative, Ty1-copia subclass [Tanacetum cinerariifolium]